MIIRFVVYLLAEYDNDVLESSRFKFIFLARSVRFKSNNLRTVECVLAYLANTQQQYVIENKYVLTLSY